jgi:hypothetical protein
MANETETSRVARDISAAIQRHAEDTPDHRPKNPAAEGAKNLADATKYSAQIKGSMMRDRTAP